MLERVAGSAEPFAARLIPIGRVDFAALVPIVLVGFVNRLAELARGLVGSLFSFLAEQRIAERVHDVESHVHSGSGDAHSVAALGAGVAQKNRDGMIRMQRFAVAKDNYADIVITVLARDLKRITTNTINLPVIG